MKAVSPKRIVVSLMAGTICAVAACNLIGTGEPQPPPDFPERPGITVSVRDADTGERLMGATVTAMRGDVQEVLIGRNYGRYEGIDTPGTYTLTVEVEGYEPRTVENIRVLNENYLFQDYVPVDVAVKLNKLAADQAE
jgi:hypothetical protein